MRFGAAPGFLERHRAAIASWAALSVMAGGLVAYAVRADGHPVHRAELDDGGVWVTNQSWGALGRQNREVAQIDGVVYGDPQGSRTENNGLDVLQNGVAVVMVDRGGRTVRAVDTQTSEASDQSVVVKDEQVRMGGSTVGVTEAQTGKTWLTRVEPDTGIASLAELSGDVDPLTTVGGDAVLAIGTDGTAYVVSRTKRTLTTIAPAGDGFADPATAPLDPEPRDAVTQVTAVGDDVAYLDATGTLAVPSAEGSGRQVDVGDRVRLQQPGPRAGSVLLGTTAGLTEVDLATGASSVVAEVEGTPADPVRVQDCDFGAWVAGRSATVVTRCAGGEPVTGRIDGLGPTPELAFRVNRDRVVLNDMRNGDVWAVEGAQVQEISNWEAWEPQESTDQDDDDRKSTSTTTAPKPQAKDDDLGVRPGADAVLHVLDNDSAPRDAILSITDVQDAGREGVRVRVAPDRQSLVVSTDQVAAGSSTSFDYTVDDGSGRGRSGQAEATVRLQVTADQGTAAPRLREHYEPTVYPVAAGASVEVPVTGDWRDPTYGDPITVEEDSLGTQGGSAALTPEGLIRFTADAGTGAQRAGRRTVEYEVGTGGETARGRVRIDVVAGTDTLAPRAQNDVAEGVQDSWITLRPLDNDVPGADPMSPDAELTLAGDVPPKSGLQVQTDKETGVVRVRGTAPGTYTLGYTAGFGSAAPSRAQIRVDVAAGEQVGHEPIATPDTTAVRGTASRTVDVLANDHDPRGRMLAVTHAEAVDPDSPLAVAVIEGRWLRVTATDDGMTPVTQRVRYTISNGEAEATATVAVTQRPALRGRENAPDAVDDEATVRAGDSVAVPVLENDSTPSGDPVGLVVDETVEPVGQLQVLPSGTGATAYVAGNKVRVVAPPEVDGPTDLDVSYVVQNTGDPTAERSSGRIRVHVVPAPQDPADNQAPTPRALEGRVVQGDTVTVTLPPVGSDPDGDSVSIAGVASAPTLGRILSASADTITYQAFPGSAGTDEFRYEVSDTFGATAEGTVRIGVVPPGLPQEPVAVDDLVTVDPSRTLTYDVVANDLRTPGTRLRTPPLRNAPPGAVITEDGVVTVPGRGRADGQVLPVPYSVSTGLADDTGELAIRYREGFNNPPQVGTVVASPEPDSGSVEVDVMAKTTDIDDDLDDLVVDQVTRPEAVAAGTAAQASTGPEPRVGADGTVTLPVGETTTVWTYRVTDPAGGQAAGVIYVPARPAGAPYLRDDALVEMEPGSSRTVDLADLVVDPEDDPVVLTTTDLIGTSPSGAEALVEVGATTETTIELTAGEQTGPAALTFEVSDRPDLDDPEAHRAVLTVPVQVGDPTPALACPGLPIEVPESGVSTTVDVAAVCHVWTADPADAAGLSFTGSIEEGLDGVEVVEDDGRLQLEATRATAGDQGTLTVGVEGFPEVTDELLVSVVALPAPSLGAITTLETRAGEPVEVDLAPYLDTPVPDAALDPAVIDVTPIGGAPDVMSYDGTTLRFDTPAEGHGHHRYRVVMSDSGPDAESSRTATGSVAVDVIDVPGAPTGLRTNSDYLSNTVALNWQAPADNGDNRIQHYEVEVDGSVAERCPTTSCRITGLENGEQYTFRVRAVNSVGPSREWSNSAVGEPDALTGPVRDLRVELQRDRMVRLAWDAPAECDCSPVQEYRISWPGGGIRSVPAGTTRFDAPVGGNGEDVVFTVAPYNTKGVATDQGPRTTVTGMGAGRPDTPAAPALGFQDVAGRSTKAVQVSWGPVAPNGPGPATYTVTRSGGGGPKTVCEWVQATSCQDQVANDGATYAYTVKARNAEATSTREAQAGGAALHESGSSAPASIEAAAQPDGATITRFAPTGKDGEATLTYDVGPSHGKENTVSCTVNGRACGTWTHPVGGERGVTRTLSGLPDGSASGVSLWSCNGSSGGLGAGQSCSGQAGDSTTTYGPIGEVSISAASAGSGTDPRTSWSARVDPNGRPVTVTVTHDGATIESFTTGTQPWSGSGSQSVSNSHTSRYEIVVSDTTGGEGPGNRAGRRSSASATSPAAPPPPDPEIVRMYSNPNEVCGPAVGTDCPGAMVPCQGRCYQMYIEVRNWPAPTRCTRIEPNNGQPYGSQPVVAGTGRFGNAWSGKDVRFSIRCDNGATWGPGYLQ